MTKPANIAHNRLAETLASPDRATKVEVSVVVPLYNETETLQPLCERIGESLRNRTFEILLVDDGSRDSSWQTILEIAAANPLSVRGFRHRGNRGKAEALSTGFAYARGRFVITIDADLQDDPAEIPALLAKLDEGYDLVSGWKQRRQDPLSKTIPSRVFNLVTRAVSGLKLHDFNCGLKGYRQDVAKSLHLYGELHRFIPILAKAEGFRVAEIPVRHFPRQYGVSKYGWKRIFKGFLDLITVVMLTRYLKRPGHFFGGIGLIVGALGLAILTYLSIGQLFFDRYIAGRPLFFFGILAVLFSGQLISTGIIGEFVLRHRRRPSSKHYVAEETSGSDLSRQ